MCYNCTAIKSYAKGISESMKKGMRVAALVLVCILLLSMGASAMAAEYSRYSQAKTAVSNDSTIIMRVNPDSSTQAENVVKTFSRVEGKTFELLGETGDWYYARYEGSEGFVRKKDFDLQTASVSTASTTTPQYSKFSAAKSGVATDSAIWMRATASKDAEVTKKFSGVRGKTFSLLGESGDWYYAQYEGAEGFVRKQDFTLQSGSTSASSTTPQYSKFSAAKSGTATDSAIWMRAAASQDAEVTKKFSGVRGETFTLLGESGDWYYAQYEGAEGFVRKQDFTLPGQAAPAANLSQPSGDKWGSIKVSGTKINHTIYCNAISGNDYKYNKSYYNIFSMTNYSSQVTVLMGHNMRKSAGSSKGMFHDLHHVQNAFLGRKTCESCGRSCSGAKTDVFNINYQGYSKWKLLCFYETPSSGSYNVLVSTATGTGNPSSWLSTQYANARNNNYKGMVLDSSGTGSDRLMVLITCGDTYGSTSTSRLYMVLKAIS